MNKLKESYIEEIENLQNDYGACKIGTNEFIEGLNKLGIFTAEEVDEHLGKAEDARYEYKIDGVEPTTTVFKKPTKLTG